ncbi:hypothetical protein RRV45_08020 [Bacillus sp. DTU_2020_1000418_1_SI_GHA_SEK_038]|uniref:hypothetical protein n=1 Tax=Bacillus sp. DTU_2020_1000418_1_SI_GHA_SEK_038 TaxID=3077585 RepID=UPI0028E1F111|nr:hypothetical protein [Bacillus sp. DTU_2020_1000418_1_SI_GHA_SEK_038]WNS76920.1 hypothetical protein RRV45_08020 [Bacillus sp. DTU_2020_1000418_1_SI_GHA_SEK_038]
MIVKWITVNVLTIFIILFWSFINGYDSNYILMGKILAQAAFILFLININMYFVFLLIRKSKVRQVKIKLAKISKEMMKYHIPIGITATLLIFLHSAIMIYTHIEDFWILKTTSGILSIGILPLLLYSGLLRRWKASGRRRRFHYTMAFIFFGTVLIHIFI